MRKVIVSLTLLSICLFACKKDKAPETVTDIDGNVYKTVKIGDQVWMAENLKTTRLNDGAPIALIPGKNLWSDVNYAIPKMCYYANDYANFEKYGALYNGYAVQTGKLAPAGWHVPTNADWSILFEYLNNDIYNFNGDYTYTKAFASTSGWASDPTPGNVGYDQVTNNKTGFNALPGGRRLTDGSYLGIGNSASFFSIYPNEVGDWRLNSYANKLEIGFGSSIPGYSVRCVKD